MPQLSRRAVIAGLGNGALALLAANCSSNSRPARRPNFVVILGDFMGYSDIEPYGANDIKTPNLARLAREGVRFSDAHSTAPICTPSRAALLTGRYQQRFGIEANIGVRGTKGLPGSEATVARLLKQAGYRTAMFGKWHLGSGPEFGPHGHGFDQSLAFHSWSIDYFSHREPAAGQPDLYRNDQPTEVAGYSTDIFTDNACSFIDDSGANPFFVYVAYNAALPPAQPPNHPDDIRATGPGPVDRARWDGDGAYTRSDYVGTVEALDAGIGRILDALERNRIADDTVVVFAYDHGGAAPARFTPLSGRFSQLLEGGIRVPLIVRWPKQLQAGRVSDEPVSLLDVTPTMLTAAGAPIADGRALDGIDLVPILQGTTPAPQRTLFWRHPFPNQGTIAFVKAARKAQWKYVSDQDRFLGREPEMLFDLHADISEQRNIAHEHPDVVRELREAITGWEARIMP